MIQELILPCIYAFVASLAFAVLFNIQGFGLVICGIGGALGWAVYLLAAPSCNSPILQSFFAALSISAYAEIMSRIRKCPVTGYLLISFFPLVPGAGIYYTMLYAMRGETALAAEQGMHTLGIAGCLAVGVLVMSSLVRMIISLRGKRRKH